MKTKMNINQIARMSLASLAVFFMSAVTPVQAYEKTDTSLNREYVAAFNYEVRAAVEKLDVLSMNTEELMKYTAPALDEDIKAYEIQAAAEWLDNLNLTVEDNIRYQATTVNEEAEAYELAVAKEKLDDLNLTVEQTIKFSAPVNIENEIPADRLEYANSRNFTIPTTAIAIGLVLAR